MIAKKSVGIVAGLVCLLLWPAHAVAQQGDWERRLRAGEAANQQGNYAEAVKQTKAALSLAEAFGPNDPRLAQTLNNLAVLYSRQGRDAEAELLYKRALAIVEKALGPEHPEVAIFLTNLAVLYSRQRRDAEAELLYRRALAIVEKALGPEHPDVAWILKQYAELLRAMDGPRKRQI